MQSPRDRISLLSKISRLISYNLLEWLKLTANYSIVQILYSHCNFIATFVIVIAKLAGFFFHEKQQANIVLRTVFEGQVRVCNINLLKTISSIRITNKSQCTLDSLKINGRKDETFQIRQK